VTAADATDRFPDAPNLFLDADPFP